MYVTANDMMCSIAGFLWGTLVMSYFAKERIKKVMNLCIFGWFIFFSPPLIDSVFFGGCSQYNYDFARFPPLKVKDIPSLIFFPAFLVRCGYSPGFIIESLAASFALVGYILIKTKSFLRVLGGWIIASILAQISVQYPFFWYLPSVPVSRFKLIPFSFEWYFSLFLLWSFFTLLVNRKFASRLLHRLKPKESFLAFILVTLGMLLLRSYTFDIWELFIKVSIVCLLFNSLAIFLNSSFRFDLETITSIFIDKSKKQNLRFMEFAINFQILALCLAGFYHLLGYDRVILKLVIFFIILIYTYLASRKIKILRCFSFGLIFTLILFIGSSKLFISGELAEISILGTVVFILFFLFEYFNLSERI